MSNRLNLSKTKYCHLWQCPKRAWLQKFRPELAEANEAANQRMEAGRKVGEIAKGLFNGYVDVSAFKQGHLDIPAMVYATKREMQRNAPVICEASFNSYGLFCAVDILRREQDGWAIYEVKSSTKPMKGVYIADVAYQLYVLERCGVNVTSVNIVTLNRDYVLEGALDINQLFAITDVTAEARAEQATVEDNIGLAAKIFASDKEPNILISSSCRNPYPCPFWNYCSKDISLASLIPPRPDFVDPDNLKRFIRELWYPLYFLDFETLQPVIPKYQGTRPFDQISFQYSLHYYDYANGELNHKEYLAEPGTDPRRGLAEKLCADIPTWACIVAYNKSFECTRLKELANAFPDLKDHLLSIENHIIDLLVPFRSGWLYKQAMGDSFSIKSVLPALCPDDPELDYHNLEQVHNGVEAMTAFPAMEHMEKADQERTRRNLLKYCELDTLAMVKILEKLREAAR